ncbi:antifreeze protein, type I [Mesorhizobium sp. 131-2-5]|uniref:glycosyltransferase n=1 Tax=Mesorhizobium sp. 131-2-5 TaxID=2744519 RepID=UPI0019277557|nr:glycosyltransferase [Mesorhizobium sp. 131-2-5]BCH01232.1 antifreeze protein, type I [Mesorhizobium sp. 131-2-5]
MRLDILFVADVRFEGGTSTALAVEIRAAARAGFKTGLLAVKGPLLRNPYPMHPDLRALIDGGATERIDPDTKVDADLVLVHHPAIMSNRFTRRTGIRTERMVMVLHHPMVDRRGKLQYDLARIVSNCRWAFGVKVWLATVSAVVRDALPRHLPAGAELLPENWTNLIDLDDWPRRPDGPPHNPVIIGRHARPDKLKWPSRAADALRIYPADAARYSIRILGGGPFLRELYGPLPANWEILPFAWTGIAGFLQGLDFYVYYHSDSWSEAFGRTILEALAVGLVTILPAHFQPLFGDAAVYAAPRDVEGVIGKFITDADAYARQSALAREFVARYHSAELFPQRLERLFNISKPRDAAAVRASTIQPLPIRQVLFASSNGIGMGHLAQQLAVAQRLPRGLKPVFATMSYAMKIAAEEGYHAHFLTHHRGIDAAPVDWNDVLAEELFDLISHLRPAVFAYDATAVFDGVVAALAMDPNLFSIWVRRPMWRESHRPFLEMADAFDAVIEPGELADEFDHGPTSEVRDKVLLVPPVLLLEPNQRLDRAAARNFLEISDGMTVVALQLGSGSNFDMRGVRNGVLKAVLDRPDTLVLDIRSPIRADFESDEPIGPRHRIVELFPSFNYSRAFDAAVVAPGYNTFHENILGAVPTLFVPNESDEMDLQLNRARWAELGGFGLLMRRDHDLPHVDRFIEELLDPTEREGMAARCEAVPWTNGADVIANYIEDHARTVRTDWDITKDS